jgi:hypothetical protein
MLAWRISGELLRRKSLPPNCKMTILVPCGTSLDSRASMPPVVSPDTPAFVTRRPEPRACSIACSWAGKDSEALTPLPAVLLAPRATTCADADPISIKNRNIAAGIFPKSCTTTSNKDHRVRKANGSRADDKLRVHTIKTALVRWWARRKSAFAHPTATAPYTLIMRLPRFSPASNPISAFGVFSRPLMTSS